METTPSTLKAAPPTKKEVPGKLTEIFNSFNVAPDPKITAGNALVVEDDYKSAQLIRILLESQGFKVLHAPTAEAAFILAAENVLSVITLDIMLPNMNGWEFLVRLQRVPELARVPIVVISCVADPAHGFALGAAAILQKPLRRQLFQDTFIGLGLFPAPEEKDALKPSW